MQSTFDALGVPTDLVSTLHARGIRAPFPIQALTIADGCAGRDLSGRAPTGSGKTLAFGIPLVARVSGAKPKRPRGLVLVPTRELAAQVCSELEWLGHGRRLRVAAVYGGVGFGAQLKALRRGVDVVVACPGRLTDLIERKECSLRDVEIAVVDEADRMADMGFLPVVRKLLDQTPDTRQTLLFSATLDGVVDTLVRGYQREPVRHELPDVDVDVAPATHHFWRVERDQRVRRTAEVIEAAGPTIVFCRTKRGTDTVARKLEQAGVRTAAIHGNRSQGQRERALAEFTAATSRRSWPPTSRPAASTSTASPAWCTSILRTTRRTTRTVPVARLAPAHRASSCRSCSRTRSGGRGSCRASSGSRSASTTRVVPTSSS